MISPPAPQSSLQGALTASLGSLVPALLLMSSLSSQPTGSIVKISRYSAEPKASLLLKKCFRLGSPGLACAARRKPPASPSLSLEATRAICAAELARATPHGAPREHFGAAVACAGT